MQPRDLALRRAGLNRSSSRWQTTSAVFILGLIFALVLVRQRNATLRANVASVKAELEFETLKSRIALLESNRRSSKDDRAAPSLAVLPLEAPSSAVPSTAPPPVAGGTSDLPQSAGQTALPKCSVVFFHHIEKTAGTTLRSVLQRNAQLGHFDFFSFINRFNKLQFQMITHRLDSLIATPGGIDDLRLAIEIHIGGGNYEHFLKYTLPDLLLIRSKLRAAGCRCNLVTLLRNPLMAHISWHHHFVQQRVPLCFWNSPYDCQSRMSIALACHGGPSVRPLTAAHRAAVSSMWSSFDLVGVTEFFDEFLVEVRPHISHLRVHSRATQVHPHTTPRKYTLTPHKYALTPRLTSTLVNLNELFDQLLVEVQELTSPLTVRLTVRCKSSPLPWP